MSSVHLGIDFGTSHTVAVLNRGGMAVPLLFDSSPILPSAVYADPGTGLVVGADAVNSARLEPARFEPNPKRRVDDGQVLLGDKEFAVEELFAAVLARVRRDCERVVGAAVSDVTLTHPAAWGSARRLVLADAAEAAGFGDARLIPEPVAAAAYFTHVLRHDIGVGSGVVVADLGGGTFDASVVTADESGFAVLSVDGIENLGGVDVDHALLGLLTDRFGEDASWRRLLDPQSTDDRRLLRGLYEDVRSAKERLSRQVRADLPVPLVGADTHFTRDELEQVTRPLLQRAVRVTKAVIRASGLPDERLSGVFLVGGASRMPLVAGMLHQALGMAPVVLEQPELVVAQGATSQQSPTTVAPPPTPVPRQPAPAPVPVTTGPAGANAGPMPPVAVMPSPPLVPVPRTHRPPATVRVARVLMGLNSICVIGWIIGCAMLLEELDARGIDESRLWSLVLMPVGIALSIAVLIPADMLRRRRTDVTLTSALTVDIALIVVAVTAAVLAFDFSDAFLIGALSTLIPQTLLSVTAAVLFRTESCLRWFAFSPPRSARTEIPPTARAARGILWAASGFGLLLAYGHSLVLIESVDSYLTDDTELALLILPVMFLGTSTLTGICANRLPYRAPWTWHLAIAATVAAAIGQLGATVAIPSETPDGDRIPLLIATVVFAAITVTGTGLLSGPVARRWFTAPPAPPS